MTGKKDFLAKIYIALKECSEILYWLELLYETEYLSKKSLIPSRKILGIAENAIFHHQNHAK